MKPAHTEAALIKLKTEFNEEMVLGYIDHITDDGIAFVDFPSNLLGPTVAISTISTSQRGEIAFYKGAKVLLSFLNRDPARPVIVGFVHDTLFPAENLIETVIESNSKNEAVIDGEKIQLDAKEEILLRCGKSAILLKKDGKVVIKGIEITNRAARTNRIRGGSVRIN